MWLQEGANELREKGRLSEKELDELFQQCLQEADSEGRVKARSFPADVFHAHETSHLHLREIGKIQGINALAPRKALDFGPDNLAVVYGGNGSGKSGYVRILKHVCGARNPGVLHPNVFAGGGSTQSANIKYSVEDETRHVSWSVGDGTIEELRPTDIFDTECGRMYLESESEVSYEPPALVFFSDLIAACEAVAGRIDGELRRQLSKKPQLPADFAGTTTGKWYSSLNATTPPGEVVTHTKWDAEDSRAVTELEERLAEKAPEERARELRAKKKHADELTRSIEGKLAELSDEGCRNILKLKADRDAKRQAAEAAATKVFSGAPLDGIGTDAWKELWEYARQYSESHAYPDVGFPNLALDAKCVLCHQPLAQEARQRLASFEEFVKGEAEKEANAAEYAFDRALNDLGEIPTDEAVKMQCDAAGVTYEGDMPPVTRTLEALRQRKSGVLNGESIDNLSTVPNCAQWLQEVKAKAAEYDAAAGRYQEDAASDNRQEIQAQLRELKARKWVSEQAESVQEEIERKKATERLHKARRLTDTRGLSRKKGELAEALITEAFVKRFREELEVLGASRINVELVKKRVDRGHVLHELRLANARPGAPSDILSEGEHRVVSLAAFLADVTGRAQRAPFVFDDPVSSLDQDFEEAVVERLVGLAADKQVIVFTHRISLMTLLQEYGRQEGREPKVTCVRSESWGTGEPGDTPLYAKKPDRALNVLLNETLARARKVHDEEGQVAYAPLAKAICSDFRIILERMIESELLADVVQRFRRAINTQGKLKRVASVTPDDCRLFDELMSKYSRYEHSQPGEAPVAPPTPDELQTDMEALRDWRVRFLARSSE